MKKIHQILKLKNQSLPLLQISQLSSNSSNPWVQTSSSPNHKEVVFLDKEEETLEEEIQCLEATPWWLDNIQEEDSKCNLQEIWDFQQFPWMLKWEHQ